MRYFNVQEFPSWPARRIQADGFYVVGTMAVFYKGLFKRLVAVYAAPHLVVEVPAKVEEEATNV